jgi:tetratricopeptide (TPR) repeat protein
LGLTLAGGRNLQLDIPRLALFARALLAAWLLSLGTAAISADAQDIARGNTPGWLVERQVPDATPEMIAKSSDGITWLLTDWQARAVAGGYESYYRNVSRVNERSGLEAAGEVRIEFDPSDEVATLNFVHIIRDGKVIDHTDDLKLKLLQREDELDDGLINGLVTAVGNISDVRVGDIVDFGVTYRITDKLWPGHFFKTISTRWSEPLALRTARISWPSNRPLSFRAINTDAAFSQHSDGQTTVYELVQRDPAPQSEEDDVPSWYPAYGTIAISSMTSWREVAEWAAPLYKGDESLPDEFARKVDHIAATYSDPADRLTEAARLVQDTIRYVGVEIAEGSFVPRRPREVVELGYGDCKDKSLLLATVLKRLGIDAAPALVSTDTGKNLTAWGPSPANFDHVIVRAQLDGKPVWIDPTLTFQGGRGAGMVTPDYGYVLPVREGQADLELIAPAAPRNDLQHAVEHYEIDEAGDPAMQLTVKTVFRDGDANWLRAKIASRPISEIAKDNLGYYLKRYPGIAESRPLAIDDDRDANVITMIETYSVSKADFDKDKLADVLSVNGYLIQNVLPDKQGVVRVNPLHVNAPVRLSQDIELHAKGRTLARLPDVDQSADGVEFTRATTADGDAIRIAYTLTTARETVPAGQAADVYAITDRLNQATSLEYHLANSRKSLATTLGVDAAVVAPYQDRIVKVGELFQKNDEASRTEALTLLNAMSSEVKRPSKVAGVIDGFTGAALAAAHRYPAAKAALESMIGQYQGSFALMQLLATLQLEDREFTATAGTLEVMAAQQPDAMKSFDEDMIRQVLGALRTDGADSAETAADDLTIALAKSGWQESPITDSGESIRSLAIKYLLWRGMADDARQLYAVAPVPAETAAELAIDKRDSALWPDLEDAVRDHFHAMVQQQAARSGEALAKSPGDLKLITRHMRDLRRAGRPDEAIAAAKDAAADRARIEAAGNDGFWLINEYAYALEAAGRPDEAVAQFDWLLSLDIKRNPSLVSQAINRALMLNKLDRPADALAALTVLDGEPNLASKYGNMWIWSGIVCAARSLDKPDVEDAAFKKMEQEASANQAAMAQALACRSDIDGLEQLMLKRFDDPREREAMLTNYVKTPDELRYKFTRQIYDTYHKALAAPALQAKLKQYGRAVQFDGWGSFDL